MIFLSEFSFLTFFRAIFLSSTAASHASFHQYFLIVRLGLLLFLLFELLAIVFRAAFFISSSIFWQCLCIFSLLVSFEFWSILWNSGQLAFSVLRERANFLVSPIYTYVTTLTFLSPRWTLM